MRRSIGVSPAIVAIGAAPAGSRWRPRPQPSGVERRHDPVAEVLDLPPPRRPSAARTMASCSWTRPCRRVTETLGELGRSADVGEQHGTDRRGHVGVADGVVGKAPRNAWTGPARPRRWWWRAVRGPLGARPRRPGGSGPRRGRRPSRLGVEPVGQVADVVVLLHADVGGMGGGQVLRRGAGHVVAVEVERHPRLLALGGGGVDDRVHGRDDVGGKSAEASVLPHQVRVVGDVDAVDLVVGDVALDPLDPRRMVARTPFDVRLMSCSSVADRVPAPGMCRSITYFGMVRCSSCRGWFGHRRSSACERACERPGTMEREFGRSALARSSDGAPRRCRGAAAEGREALGAPRLPRRLGPRTSPRRARRAPLLRGRRPPRRAALEPGRTATPPRPARRVEGRLDPARPARCDDRHRARPARPGVVEDPRRGLELLAGLAFTDSPVFELWLRRARPAPPAGRLPVAGSDAAAPGPRRARGGDQVGSSWCRSTPSTRGITRC